MIQNLASIIVLTMTLMVPVGPPTSSASETAHTSVGMGGALA